jgi:uncharacterized protein (DUF1800 family)
MRWLTSFALLLPMAAQAALGPDDARHLLNRAGFGATPHEIAEYALLTRAEAVDRLLAGTRKTATTPAPAGVREPITPPRALRNASPEERRAFQAQEIRRGFDLRTWWIAEMLGTPSQLTERMTLFWHNHFVSSQQKVRYTRLMYEQNVLLRRHAFGNFGDLLHAAAKDPLDLDTGEFVFRKMLHDDGPKTVLGRTGSYDGDAVLDILLDQPGTGEFVVAKLWREFVSPEPDPEAVKRIAARFRGARYDLKVALREIFLSQAFWASESRGALIKSPIDLVVGTLRALDFRVGDPLPLALVVAGLGQNLFSPPNVKGWPGGEAWINSSTLLARKQFAERVFRADEMPRAAMTDMNRRGGDADLARVRGFGQMGEAGRERFVRALYEIQFDPQRWLGQFGGAATQADMTQALLARDPVSALPMEANPRETIQRIALDPVYQLK